MIPVLITVGCWTALVAVAVLQARASIAVERRHADDSARERARNEELRLDWIELRAGGAEVVLVESDDDDRTFTREVTLATRWGDEVELRGGVPALAPERFLEPIDDRATVFVLARWPAQPEGYREGAGPIVLEPDPERGYVFAAAHPGALDLQPRGWGPYLPFFAGAALFVALSFVPWVGGAVAVFSLAWIAAEILAVARFRTLGMLTSFALAISDGAHAMWMRWREQRRREREAELDCW